ncbi:hypothetical protein LWI29_026776 [Acer saccharum]|uniref:Uncharacterized protein n=1 Tax=Acer saccharum TaxID=4024 RepID=A0AA39VZ24_ACESA|nr:hypothetical protein LWI29_026776 [Acer saccharum]
MFKSLTFIEGQLSKTRVITIKGPQIETFSLDFSREREKVHTQDSDSDSVSKLVAASDSGPPHLPTRSPCPIRSGSASNFRRFLIYFSFFGDQRSGIGGLAGLFD